MHPILRNILAVISGVILGGLVNMGIIMISGSIIPPPEGADVTTSEGIAASIHLWHPQHFLMPFLAHALGTFAGALLAGAIAANRKMVFAFVIGLFFLAGGITNFFMIPSPTWFIVVDLVGAYIPMAFIAGKLVTRKS
jgi:hypothetical protein